MNNVCVSGRAGKGCVPTRVPFAYCPLVGSASTYDRVHPLENAQPRTPLRAMSARSSKEKN